MADHKDPMKQKGQDHKAAKIQDPKDMKAGDKARQHEQQSTGQKQHGQPGSDKSADKKRSPQQR